MSAPATFVDAFHTYVENARTAQTNNQHHDYRRQIFLAFLGKAFGIQAEEIDVEKYLKIDVRKKGWIDALFRDLVFEFKRDLGIERTAGLRELRNYLGRLERGTECVGLLTDGLIFEAYILDGGELRLTDQIDLSKSEDETAFLWLDSYFFSQKQAPPKSAHIVQRFGPKIQTFQTAARTLEALF